MLNKIVIMGRLVRDPDLRRTQAGTAVAAFTLAVERDFKDAATGERTADFIDCVAWRQTGEFVRWWNRCISAIPRVKADRRVVSLCRRRTPGIRRDIRPRVRGKMSSGSCRTTTANCRFREDVNENR